MSKPYQPLIFILIILNIKNYFFYLNNKQLLFYSKHILLKKINIKGQKKIFLSKIIIIGAGGLGSILLIYLTLLGVNKIILIDNDIIELSNLQRQILFNFKDINKYKVICAKKKLKIMNPDVKIKIFLKKIDFNLLNKLTKNINFIIDCSDNFNTKYLINQIFIQNKLIYISASAIKFKGKIIILNKKNKNNPCYNCLFPLKKKYFNNKYCSNIGIFSPLISIIGSIQVTEIIKLIINNKLLKYGYLKYLNLLKLNLNNIYFKKNIKCIFCKKFKY